MAQLASFEVSLPFSIQKPFVPTGLGASRPARPNGHGHSGYLPQRTRGAFGKERAMKSAGGAQGRRRRSRLFGRREEGGAELFVFSKPKSWLAIDKLKPLSLFNSL